jgi:protein-S-isoprenylcysteine O-methyltransferase Ste14
MEFEKMTNETKDNAGVVAPPPLIFLSGILLGGLVSYFYYFPFLLPMLANVLGILLLIAGASLPLIAFLQMRKVKTHIEPWQPTTTIISDGVYRFSRNPIYLGLTLIYLGLTCLFNSVWFLPFLPLVLMAIHYGVILREEHYLENKFGEEYLNYKRRVRRWI